jgi:hypothetical protein
MKRYFVLAIVIALCACSKSTDAVVPTSNEKMDSIKPRLEKPTTEQHDSLSKEKLSEAKEKALKEKVKAEQQKAIDEMNKTVLVTLVRKGIAKEESSSGFTLEEELFVTIAFKNTSPKDITGIVGTLVATDIFGEQLSSFDISYHKTIKPGETSTWKTGRSVRSGTNASNDRKFAYLPKGKYRLSWKPDTIYFGDGTKLTKPAGAD